MKLGFPLILLAVGGCTYNPDSGGLRPAVDTGPVGCGYKWFQSGYSPVIRVPCTDDRSHLRRTYLPLAREHAWSIAEQRCPDACAPIELEDPIEAATPDNVCRAGKAYFHTRVFFQCGKG